MPEGIGTAVRAIGRLAIGGLVKQGLGSNAIIGVLAEVGLSYRRTTMLADIREFTGLMRLEKTVRQVAMDAIFPQHAMVETYLRRARRYRVFGTLTVEDPLTWERKEVNVSFYTDDRKSKEEWEQDFFEEFRDSESAQGGELLDLQIRSVSHQSGWSY
jgi:uncharacterized protein related to proFAR isomerase